MAVCLGAPHSDGTVGCYADLIFGLIEISWDPEPAPTIASRLFDVYGTTVLGSTVYLDDLRQGHTSLG